MRVSICELPAQLRPGDAAWKDAARRLSAARPDLVLLNEMPFGPWLAAAPAYDASAARQAVELHEAGLARMGDIAATAVVSSRPVIGDARLRNEAFVLSGGRYRALHQKHFFPSEPGFHEEAWFERPATDFSVHDIGPARVGILLCTECMFNEWARHYGRSGAQIILVPRASGPTTRHWQTALAMAALVSGCYVFSANRAGVEGEQVFGGKGFAYAPGGELIAETGPENPFVTVDIDLERVATAQAAYPCSVPDLPA